LGCAYTALGISCAFSLENLRFTCKCPESTTTPSGDQSETLESHQLLEFSGCVASEDPTPSLHSIFEDLAKNDSEEFVNALSIAIEGILGGSVTSINPSDLTIEVALLLSGSTSQGVALENVSLLFFSFFFL